jgi:hypothetical protein
VNIIKETADNATLATYNLSVAWCFKCYCNVQLLTDFKTDFILVPKHCRHAQLCWLITY